MISDRILRQYIAEALDPPRSEEVRGELDASSQLRERLALLLATTVDVPTSGWVLPPPRAVGPQVLLGQARPGAIMGPQPTDGWVELWLSVAPAVASHVVVVLERLAGSWAVLTPLNADEVLRASDLPEVEPGVRRLDVSVAGRLERVGVILVPDPPDFASVDPWADVRGDVQAGKRLVVTFDV